MTRREVVLLRALGFTVLAVLLLWGIQTFFDEMTLLDQRYSSLQKQAASVQRQYLEAPVQVGSGVEAPELDRLWKRGSLPEPLLLARKVMPVLETYGVAVRDFQVVSNTDQAFTLKYVGESTAPALLGALASLRAADSKLIVKKFYVVLRDRGYYQYDWEVGYATAP